MTESKTQYFLRVSNYKNEKSDYVNIQKHEILKFNNGGSWCRFDGSLSQKFKLVTVKKNKKIRHNWDINETEKELIYKEIEELDFNYDCNNNTILYVKIFGINQNFIYKQIPEFVKKHFNNSPCVSCGTLKDIEIDHKNGLYDIKTDKIDDFQPLCKHCNCVKRASVYKTKKTGIREGPPPHLNFGINFIEGNEILDYELGLRGTYWYDPIKFVQFLLENK